MTTATTIKTIKELHEGINGRGEKQFTVATVAAVGGPWLHMERFDTEAEALSWIKWA